MFCFSFKIDLKLELLYQKMKISHSDYLKIALHLPTVHDKGCNKSIQTASLPSPEFAFLQLRRARSSALKFANKRDAWVRGKENNSL